MYFLPYLSSTSRCLGVFKSFLNTQRNGKEINGARMATAGHITAMMSLPSQRQRSTSAIEIKMRNKTVLFLSFFFHGYFL